MLSAALFSVVLCASDLLKNSLNLGGWSLARGEVMWASLASPPLVLILALAAAIGWVLWATKAGGWAPAWLVGPSGTQPHWSRPALRAWQTVAVGVVSGLAGAAVVIGFSLVAGPPGGQADQEQRYYTYLWLAAVVGAVAALLLALTNGDRGRGAALLAGPVAAATVSVGFLTLNTALGGALTLDFSFRILQPAVTLGFLLYLATAWLTLIVPPVGRSGPPTALVITTAAVLPGGRRPRRRQRARCSRPAFRPANHYTVDPSPDH